MKNRILCFLLLFAILLGCSAAPQISDDAEAVRSFTDDCGRVLELPENITRIAVTGPLTQVYALPLCGDLLVGHAGLTELNMAYLPEHLADLPELGQLYGGKGTMDPEALLAAQPQVVIDLGEAKASMSEDLDKLTAQTGIPFLHIDATVETSPQAYRKLGRLLGRQEQAEALAQWCEETLSEIHGVMERVDADNARKSILYCLGDKGLNVLAEGSYHAETINLLGDNAAKLETPVSSGMGNEIDLEQLLLWDPDVIVFAPDSAFDLVGQDEVWLQLRAIQSGRYYEAPNGPYGWLASPPSVQRYLGMLWLAELLYPAYTEFDFQDKVTEYYALFYGYALTDQEFHDLLQLTYPR